MKIKIYFGIVVFLSLVLAGIVYYQNTELETASPKDAIEKGIVQLRDSGKVTVEQESYLRVQLAIADYIANNAEPPDSLESLVPKYFDTVPLDPSTKQPVSYKRRGHEFDLNFGGADAHKQALAEGSSQGSQAQFINPNTVEIEDFVYDPSGKRDPFQPFDFSPKIVIDESLPPLERYEVSQLRTAAILTDASGERFAMVEDGSGRGHPVRIGTKIGNRNGAVVSIDEDQVNVLESVTDFTGETKQNLVSIKLVTSASQKANKKKR